MVDGFVALLRDEDRSEDIQACVALTNAELINGLAARVTDTRIEADLYIVLLLIMHAPSSTTEAMRALARRLIASTVYEEDVSVPLTRLYLRTLAGMERFVSIWFTEMYDAGYRLRAADDEEQGNLIFLLSRAVDDGAELPHANLLFCSITFGLLAAYSTDDTDWARWIPADHRDLMPMYVMVAETPLFRNMPPEDKRCMRNKLQYFMEKTDSAPCRLMYDTLAAIDASL
jgi:hypothetical protein